jgi:hypothetical protein
MKTTTTTAETMTKAATVKKMTTATTVKMMTTTVKTTATITTVKTTATITITKTNAKRQLATYLMLFVRSPVRIRILMIICLFKQDYQKFKDPRSKLQQNTTKTKI